MQGADQMRKHAAAIDIRHQYHRAVHRLGKAHIGDIALPQVDFRRTAGALHHNHLILLAQTLVRCQHRLHRGGFVIVVNPGVHILQRATVNDHLGTGIGIGLEQHRVEVGVRLETAGHGLYRLGPADFATVHGDRAV